MLLSIDFASDQPIYMQIRNSIIAGIAFGKLADGDPLPSVRTLAAEISVNLHTVNKAYQLLQSEGFIEIQRRRGTFIKAGDAAKHTADFLQHYDGPLKDIIAAAVSRHVDRAVVHQMIDRMYDETEASKS